MRMLTDRVLVYPNELSAAAASSRILGHSAEQMVDYPHCELQNRKNRYRSVDKCAYMNAIA